MPATLEEIAGFGREDIHPAPVENLQEVIGEGSHQRPVRLAGTEPPGFPVQLVVQADQVGDHWFQDHPAEPVTEPLILLVQLVDDRFPVRGTPVERGELPLDPAQAPGQFAQRTRDAIVSRRRLFPGPRVLLVLARARRAGDRGRARFCASQSGSPLSAAPGGNGFAAGRGVLPFIPVPTPMGTRPHVHSAILQDTQATMGTRYARELRTYS
jgi:hypothetical protein